MHRFCAQKARTAAPELSLNTPYTYKERLTHTLTLTLANLGPRKCWLLQSLTPDARWHRPQGQEMWDAVRWPPSWGRGRKSEQRWLVHLLHLFQQNVLTCVVSEVLSEHVAGRLSCEEHCDVVASLVKHLLCFPFFTFSSLVSSSSLGIFLSPSPQSISLNSFGLHCIFPGIMTKATSVMTCFHDFTFLPLSLLDLIFLLNNEYINQHYLRKKCELISKILPLFFAACVAARLISVLKYRRPSIPQGSPRQPRTVQTCQQW